MRQLIVLAGLLAGPAARADEPAPMPRPAPDPGAAAVTAFFDDLRANNPKAAFARLSASRSAFLSSPDKLGEFWGRLLDWHGPLTGVKVTKPLADLFVVDLRFERHPYLFKCGVTKAGKLVGANFAARPHAGPAVLRAGHGVRVTPADPAKPADGVVTFAVPALYREQVPLGLTVAADPPAALVGCKLRRRDDGHNWLVEARVRPGKEGATVFWEAAVLVRDPQATTPPTAEPAVPPEAAKWARPSGCVQSDDPGVVERANKLQAGGGVGGLARAVAAWVANNNGTGKPTTTLDAAAALGCGGSCTSRANLAAALLRARGVPARTVAHLPVWAGPHYVHWLTEYWHPGAGWERVEPSLGKVRPAESGLVVLNIANPDDEDEAVFPNRRSFVMDGAARLSSRELDGAVRSVPAMHDDLRCWGLAVPLAKLAASPAELDALWALARKAHAGLAPNDPKRLPLAAAAQRGGVAGLTAALRPLAGD